MTRGSTVGRYWQRWRRLVETTDGAGIVYRLPEGMPLMDCARCGRACTRRMDMAQDAGAAVRSLGGHMFNERGHPRPYCYPCYLAERGLT